jgi:hypothetical protein
MYLKNNQKSANVRVIIEEAIDIISVMGVPILEQTERRKERMAMAFLAVAGVTSSWQEARANDE